MGNAPSYSYSIHGPASPETPVILSVPHAGRAYPPALLAMSRVPVDRLVSLEDRYADALIGAAVAQGFTAIVAQRPRAWIDLNRHEREVDPDMIEPRLRGDGLIRSAKVTGGLGLIPRRLRDDGDLWLHRIAAEDLQRRIAEDYRPYHEALRNLMRAARARFGIAVLLDVHSMPPIDTAQIVIGNLFGRSAASTLPAVVRETAQADGLRWADNAPYAGGHILTAHADPKREMHGIQIEIDRTLYLKEDLRTPRPDLGGMDRFIANIAQRLADRATDLRLPQAAE